MRTESYVTPESIEARASQWVERVYSVVRTREHITVRPQSTALVVVDMINFFAHPQGRGYLPVTRAMRGAVERLVRRIRDMGGPVIVTRHCNSEADASSLGRFFGSWIECGWESETVDFLKEVCPDLEIVKHTYDSFHGTPLDSFLKERNISTVVVAGVMTHLCVETTARSAFVRGYDVIVPADATAANLEVLHTAALLALGAGVARIVTSSGL